MSNERILDFSLTKVMQLWTNSQLKTALWSHEVFVIAHLKKKYQQYFKLFTFSLLKVLQETIISVSSSAVDQHTSSDFETVEEYGEVEGIFFILNKACIFQISPVFDCVNITHQSVP